MSLEKIDIQIIELRRHLEPAHLASGIKQETTILNVFYPYCACFYEYIHLFLQFCSWHYSALHNTQCDGIHNLHRS